MRWFEYHDLTKHTVERLHSSSHYLDWANMPDPFRHYEGVPAVDLPADAAALGQFDKISKRERFQILDSHQRTCLSNRGVRASTGHECALPRR